MYDLDDIVWKTVSEEAKDLIRRLLEKDIQKRMELKEALNHPWFTRVSKN